MMEEILDKETGAILFKKTKDTQNLEEALESIRTLKNDVASLKRRCTMLENKLKSSESIPTE